MKLAFLVLAHERPGLVARLLTRLTADGDLAVLHWDAATPEDAREVLEREMPPDAFARVRFARRKRVAWGRWSVVEATFNCLDAVETSGEDIDYVVLASGADYPLRPVKQLKEYLRGSGLEHIETVPSAQPWVVRGHQEGRYRYRHWWSWRTAPRWFSQSMRLQAHLRMTRTMPDGLTPHFGSQWWALTRGTALAARDFGRKPRVARFFRTVDVPDEIFFQSYAASHTDAARIAGHGITFFKFTEQGHAVTFYNDHAALLRRQRYFLARKLSPLADDLRNTLDHHIETRADEPLEFDRVSADTADYDATAAMHREGIPNRRVIGMVEDEWWGDLEWNLIPYFIILAPPGIDVEPLREALNAQPGVMCFGELFAGNGIDYRLPGHPGYPPGELALRDRHPGNFLCDLVHHHAGRYVGFVLRTDQSEQVQELTAWDRNAKLIVCKPEAPVHDGAQVAAQWKVLRKLRDDAASAGIQSLTYRRDMTAAKLKELAEQIAEIGRGEGALERRVAVPQPVASRRRA